MNKLKEKFFKKYLTNSIKCDIIYIVKKKEDCKMPVKINGKEVTKEEFREFMLKRMAQQKEIKKLSKTELGREILRQKGIKPITD